MGSMETKDNSQMVNVKFSSEELKRITEAQAAVKQFKRTEFIRIAVSEKCDKVLKTK